MGNVTLNYPTVQVGGVQSMDIRPLIEAKRPVDAAKAALALKLRPVPLHAIGYVMKTKHGPKKATGKEPYGPRWGNVEWVPQTIEPVYNVPGRGVGLLMGPSGRLIDIEIDRPEGQDPESFAELADAELARLCGGEIPATAGWTSYRGRHRLFLWDDRFSEFKDQNTVHFGALEIRLGAAKQIQSAIPPTKHQAGNRLWDLETTVVARLPDAAVTNILASGRHAAQRLIEKRLLGQANKLAENIMQANKGHASEGRHPTALASARTMAGLIKGHNRHDLTSQIKSILMQAYQNSKPELEADDPEFITCIEDGWANGLQDSLKLDDRPQNEVKTQKQAVADLSAERVAEQDFDFAELIGMAEKDATASYRHLIEGYLEASQGMLVGMLGAGKGCFGPLLANHITNGKPWWNGRECKPGSVVIMSPEDNPETIKQRCRFAGARVHGDIVDGQKIDSGPRVVCLGSGSKPLSWPDGKPRAMDETAFFDTLKSGFGDLRLIVVDPVKSFMGKRGPSESEEDHVRRVLSASLTWANRNGVAILLVIHPAKGAGARNVNDQASGSHAWTAVTRSVISLEKNPNYGPTARALLSGRQSNAQEGLKVLFDLEIGEAVDSVGNRVPVMDSDGEVERDEHGAVRYVTTVRLTFREALPDDHEYQLPPFDREGTAKAKSMPATSRPSVDDKTLRLAAVELVAGQPNHRMPSFPDSDLLNSLGPVKTDDRWLQYACGVLARQFGLSPSTIKRKLIPVFRRDDQESVAGYITRSTKSGYADSSWFWESIPDQSPPF